MSWPGGHRGVEALHEADVIVVHEDVHVAHQLPLAVEQLGGEARVARVDARKDIGHRRPFHHYLRLSAGDWPEHWGNSHGDAHGERFLPAVWQGATMGS